MILLRARYKYNNKKYWNLCLILQYYTSAVRQTSMKYIDDNSQNVTEDEQRPLNQMSRFVSPKDKGNYRQYAHFPAKKYYELEEKYRTKQQGKARI